MATLTQCRPSHCSEAKIHQSKPNHGAESLDRNSLFVFHSLSLSLSFVFFELCRPVSAFFHSTTRSSQRQQVSPLRSLTVSERLDASANHSCILTHTYSHSSPTVRHTLCRQGVLGQDCRSLNHACRRVHGRPASGRLQNGSHWQNSDPTRRVISHKGSQGAHFPPPKPHHTTPIYQLCLQRLTGRYRT